jgi:hypothetical protein
MPTSKKHVTRESNLQQHRRAGLLCKPSCVLLHRLAPEQRPPHRHLLGSQRRQSRVTETRIRLRPHHLEVFRRTAYGEMPAPPRESGDQRPQWSVQAHRSIRGVRPLHDFIEDVA